MNTGMIQIIGALSLALAVPFSAGSKEKKLPNTMVLENRQSFDCSGRKTFQVLIADIVQGRDQKSS